ncbi:TlpA family protein disulfide reductase [Sphingobacterium faecale]|uniref:TlpA family protein disulfide reductase n=1 Tax=Sphingobacterium faecale TaxID=2803775 RepID=A0ABS1R0Z4_9SPHI|nr:TlpA disulfide reductase family protein [Sphingobacterium faecale]MBL1408350.1 TlpA family protein disulfide reductase [Sphingobacterium faecale]
MKYILFLLGLIVGSFCSCSTKKHTIVDQVMGNALVDKDSLKITPIKIGDDVPNILWDMKFPLVSGNSDKVQYISLGDFKEKLIILDFWAIWCGSCIAAFPSNFALAEEFKEDLLLVPVSLNTEKEVRKFMVTNKNGKYLSESIIDKEILKQYFPHRFIPHYVWIFKGKLFSVTDSDQLNSKQVKDLIQGTVVSLRQKKDVFDFDIRDPFDRNWESLFEEKVVAKTTLSNFVDGIGSWGVGVYNGDSSIYRHSSVNRPLISIYNLAVKKPLNHFLNEALDKSRFEDLDNDPDWSRKNTYCYEYIVPSDIAEDRTREIIVNDLNSKLNLKCRFEKRIMDCYLIIYNSDWIEAENGLTDANIFKQSLDEISLSFNNRSKYDQNSYESAPILINERTTSKGFIPPPSNIIDIESFNAFMKPQGIMAISVKREIEVFILSDQ